MAIAYGVVSWHYAHGGQIQEEPTRLKGCGGTDSYIGNQRKAPNFQLGNEWVFLVYPKNCGRYKSCFECKLPDCQWSEYD
jgi:hypothetical protein